MYRERLAVTVEAMESADGQACRRISLSSGSEHMGSFDTVRGEALVERGLILAGFSSVDVSGAGLAPTSFALWHLRKQAHQAGERLSPQVDGRRGPIELKRFFVEGKDELMFAVSFDGRPAWSWVPPHLDELDTLVAVLKEAAVDLEVRQITTTAPATVAAATGPKAA